VYHRKLELVIFLQWYAFYLSRIDFEAEIVYEVWLFLCSGKPEKFNKDLIDYMPSVFSFTALPKNTRKRLAQKTDEYAYCHQQFTSNVSSTDNEILQVSCFVSFFLLLSAA